MRLTTIILLFSICGPAAIAQTKTQKAKAVANKQAIDPATPPSSKKPATAVVYKQVDHMPTFPGDINTFLANNLIHPKAAKKDELEGKVVVQFIVRKDGSLTDAKVVKHAAKAVEQEALRIITAMPHWKPGRQNGVPVDVEMTLPITMELE